VKEILPVVAEASQDQQVGAEPEFVWNEAPNTISTKLMLLILLCWKNAPWGGRPSQGERTARVAHLVAKPDLEGAMEILRGRFCEDLDPAQAGKNRPRRGWLISTCSMAEAETPMLLCSMPLTTSVTPFVETEPGSRNGSPGDIVLIENRATVEQVAVEVTGSRLSAGCVLTSSAVAVTVTCWRTPVTSRLIVNGMGE
jgi:hypothetical protein